MLFIVSCMNSPNLTHLFYACRDKLVNVSIMHKIPENPALFE